MTYRVTVVYEVQAETLDEARFAWDNVRPGIDHYFASVVKQVDERIESPSMEEGGSDA